MTEPRIEYIGIPQAVAAKHWQKPWSELVGLIGTDGIVDARAHDYELWRQRPAAEDAEKYSWGSPFSTFKRMQGYAIMRDGGNDFRTPDTAALWFKGF